MKIRVYYEDTDAAGIVYYANYLKFCERARSELFFSSGTTPQSEEGYFVVRDLEAKFRTPARLGDLLKVTTQLTERKGASIELLQRVWKEKTILFEMRVRLAYLKEDRPARIPKSVQSLIESWKGA